MITATPPAITIGDDMGARHVISVEPIVEVPSNTSVGAQSTASTIEGRDGDSVATATGAVTSAGEDDDPSQSTPESSIEGGKPPEESADSVIKTAMVRQIN